jgi:hypothetical protein
MSRLSHRPRGFGIGSENPWDEQSTQVRVQALLPRTVYPDDATNIAIEFDSLTRGQVNRYWMATGTLPDDVRRAAFPPGRAPGDAIRASTQVSQGSIRDAGVVATNIVSVIKSATAPRRRRSPRTARRERCAGCPPSIGAKTWWQLVL